MVAPGEVYYLVIQAHGADGNVVWHGQRAVIEGALPSWGYDINYWGGWQRYDETTRFSTTKLAFAIQPDADTSCEASGTCYQATTPRPPAPLRWEGLLGNDTHVVGLDRADADGAEFVPYSDVLRLSDGRLRCPRGNRRQLVHLHGRDDPPGMLAARQFRNVVLPAWMLAGTVRRGSEEAPVELGPHAAHVLSTTSRGGYEEARVEPVTGTLDGWVWSVSDA
jgi:hypothetical protein